MLWGQAGSGQLGDGLTSNEEYDPVKPTGLPPVISMAGGDGYSLALSSDGIVWAWGGEGNEQLGNGPTIQGPGCMFSAMPSASIEVLSLGSSCFRK